MTNSSSSNWRGDELADESIRSRKSDDEKVVHRTRLDGDYNDQESEWLVATGFLRMGAVG